MTDKELGKNVARRLAIINASARVQRRLARRRSFTACILAVLVDGILRQLSVAWPPGGSGSQACSFDIIDA